ncbi:MAG: fumarylacetoacetate hydrolase family protein [Chloroflexota bacterium]|nr:fumarylacetoacetate hydrolase family protein [Chloroflexota bacterium]
MRLATFRIGDATTWGAIADGKIVDARDLGVISAWPTLLDLVRAGSDAARDFAARVAERPRWTQPPGLRLLAPIAQPPQNPVAVGLNYREHVAEAGHAPVRDDDRGRPMLFTKSRSSIVGPDEAIRIDPTATSQADWEVELTLVIGTGGRDIREADAWDHVFGYTIANDVSARDLQFFDKRRPQFFQGKSLDTFCPLGPWIVTKDELTKVEDLRITLRIDGVTKQDGRTSQLIFSIPEIIAEVSRSRTIEAGELILTGTPSGVGFTRTPPEYLTPGQVVECEIEGIGILRNPVVGADAGG